MANAQGRGLLGALVEYDFGVGWVHEITRTSSFRLAPGETVPRCLSFSGDNHVEDWNEDEPAALDRLSATSAQLSSPAFSRVNSLPARASPRLHSLQSERTSGGQIMHLNCIACNSLEKIMARLAGRASRSPVPSGAHPGAGEPPVDSIPLVAVACGDTGE